MATILTKKSDTASAVPLAADLTNAAGGAELAVNATDKRLFSKTSGGTVVELGTNPSTLVLPSGSANGVAYLNGSKVVTSGSALTFDGTTFAQTGANGIPIRIQELASVPTSQTAAYIGVSTSAFPGSNNGDLILAPRTSGGNLIKFYTGNGTSAERYSIDSVGVAIWSVSGSEQMRLTSTGLGIGTSSPSYKLDVRGSSGNIASWSDGTTTGTLYAGGGYVGLTFPAATGGFFINPSGNFNTISTNGVERMRIDSSGNLGLGVTPSAYGSGAKAFEVNASSTYWGYASGGVYITGMSNNTYGAGATNRYKNTATAGEYSITGNVHAWYTAPSGTAGNAITFTQAATLTAGGDWGVGTTSPAQRIHASSAGAVTRVLIENTDNGSAGAGIQMLVKSGASTVGNGTIRTDNADNMQFFNIGGERARIDSSGNLLVGTTSAISAGKYSSSFAGATENGIILKTTLASTGSTYIGFVNSSGSIIGSVNQNGASTVAYNTSSDYRLKNTIAPMTGALGKVALLKPCTYKWNADGSDGEGFIAHELAEVVPQCVTGEKDAVDEEGNPKYQGIDTSFLVATLTAALQELNAKFDAYVASHP